MIHLSDQGGPPLSPERVFALVVGIESYQLGADWNLRGPARDAVRFTDWLTGPGEVPAENVRLFLSPLPTTAPTTAAPSAGVAHRPATGSAIENELMEELPLCDGELLLIYWAGHGFAGDYDQLILPFADTSTGQFRHLDLDSALLFWNSNKVHRSFRRIVSIGDACRLDPRSGARASFGRTDYRPGKRVNNRRTFLLYASRPGLPAQNLAGAGRLTDSLLKRLAGRTLDAGIRQLPDIARQVHTDLTGPVEQGSAPVQEIEWRITGWDGTPVVDEAWWDEPACAPRLDEQAWTELRALLPGPELPPEAYHAYRWAFEAAGCAPPGPVLPAAEPMAVVRDLDQRVGGGARRLPLPLAFVAYLAARESDGATADGLADWVRRTGARLGADAVPAPPAPERDGRAELHVQLAESSAQDAFLSRTWLYRGGFETLWESAGPVTLAAVQEQLVRLLFDTAVGPQVGRIEFHVPEPLLDEEFERWPVPTRGHRQGELGRAYEVVVRCPDERTHQSGHRWVRKWAWYRKHGGRHPDAVLALAEGTPLDHGLVDRLGADGHPVCALLGRHPASLRDRLEMMLDAGLPIALWPRGVQDDGCRPDCGGGGGNDLRAVLAEAEEFDLDRLPAMVKRLRIGGGAYGCAGCLRLGLLWDDPEHRPQPGALS
ncbi:hypothetical protein [Kitasatospora sp. NPDC101183]|uniref:VMAP-C domain-containing protein n=1 Tax=Kitasatospora sp. NPDC101183 TaxID=3364100 RepID=UPI0038043928